MRCLMRDGFAVTRAAFRPLGFREGNKAGPVVNRTLAPCGEGQGGQEEELRLFPVDALSVVFARPVTIQPGSASPENSR